MGVSDDIEDLIGAELATDFAESVQQFLENAAFARVDGYEVDDGAVALLSVAVNTIASPTRRKRPSWTTKLRSTPPS